MKQISKVISTSCLAAVAVFSMGAQASNLSSADVNSIHSATFDGAPVPDGSFIPPVTGTNVTFTNVGTANGGTTATGTGILEYNGTTLRLASVLLPDLDVSITAGANSALVNTSGATLSLAAPGLDTEAGFPGFQVEASPVVVADFSTFSTVVTACTEASAVICPGVPFLNLDGVRYEIDGTVTAAGGDTITLTLQTSNNSVLIIDVVTAPVAEEASVASADVLGIHSATFDGAPAADGTFIPAITGTNVTFTNVGTANGGSTATGTGIVEYDGTTLRLASVLLPDLDVSITAGANSALVNTSGATVNLAAPGLDTEAGFAGFQVEASPVVVADFSTFSTVVTACTEASAVICPGVPFLNLDGVRYEIDGTITEEGGDTLTLTLQTSNNSVLSIELTTLAAPTNVPVPAFALFGIFASLGLIVYSNRKRVA